MKLKYPLLVALAAAVFVPAARADLSIDLVFSDIRLGRTLPPPPPEVVVVQQSGPSNPPPWTQTRPRWNQRNHNYYYYPGTDVYYRADNRTWFYLERGSWRSASQLPPGIRVDFGQSVSLSLIGDRPYAYHRDVVAYYPANYFSRVRYRNERDNRWADDRRHGNHDRDHNGRDDRDDHNGRNDHDDRDDRDHDKRK